MIDRTRASQMDFQSTRTRIGAVSYLNSKPLIEGLADRCPDADLLLDVPSRLADQLNDGGLDVALIPSVEAFSNPEYEVVSDACVATHGPVHSVKLYSRVHPGEVRRLALDEGSRTSAALSRIMLDERFGVKPELERLPLGCSVSETTADAVLLIGDRAMSAPQEKFHTIWDLGQEWVEWTGLPFVFAMWVARKGQDLQEVEQELNGARDSGLQQIEEIARRESQAMSLSYDMVHRYFTRNLHFRLGDAEQMGLRLFHELAVRHGFADDIPLEFRQTTGNRKSRSSLVTAS